MKITKFILFDNIEDWNDANSKAKSLIPNIIEYAQPRQVINDNHDDFGKYMFPIIEDTPITVSGQQSLLQDHFPSGQDFNYDWIADF